MAEGMQQEVLGIIGGMSWESTVTYYQEINRRYNARRGGHHSAPLLINSVDFAPIEAMQRSGDWSGTARILIDAARALHRAGATVLLLATNTMHLVLDELADAVALPWIHIADATGEALAGAGIARVGLLGTRFTMEQPFYRDRLADRFGVEVVVPAEDDRRLVDEIIFSELVHGHFTETSREHYREVMQRVAAAGADAVVFGCTEIGLLVGGEDSPVAVYDTTQLHAAAAVERLLSEGEE
ncbi:MAG: aspartate/glutamate racemase family protein [Alkalispirochaeta sp.]